ncbi:hypothetical protein VTN77DRAFT_3724 [Rasamsonia byssochlamydoides]|uniref:uncharacterized protein n=1 Tax=Rasamsonia byssochlamydoides TaxID=89139 RepID=UPI00374372D1
MSYALETKKRKFNRVLESISKPLANDAASKTTKDPVMAVRERLATPPSIKRVRIGDESLEGITTKTGISKIAVRTSPAPSNDRPNFVPWDRERFLERLETFRPVTRWSPKPAPINEVEWAKRGWSCTDYMRVTCVGGCGSSVVVKLPEEVDDFDELDSDKVRERKEVRAKVVEEYTRILSEGHSENCPWRSKGCDATIHRLPLTNPDVAISALQKRYLKVADMGSQLPSRDIIEVPENLKLDEIIKMLPPEFLRRQKPTADSAETEASRESSQEGGQTPAEPDNVEQQIDETALSLAFFGWDVVKDGSSGLLECRACFRRLGLWLYKPKENGQSAVYSKLSVVDEHMDYCPWINGKAQSGTGKATEKVEALHSGWEILAQSIKTKHRRRVRSSASEKLRRDSDASSLDYTSLDEETKKAKDREWWSKLRRVREALHVRAHRKSVSGDK